MFTESVRIGCGFQACHSESTKPFMTLDPDHGSTNLETVLLCLYTSCHRDFLSCPILLPPYLEAFASLSGFSTQTPLHDRP